MLRKIFLALLMVLPFGVACLQTAHAQKYPIRPIEILVPFSAGSTFDLIPRVIADIAPKYLGQPVFVTNKPGAAGTVAANEVISSKPDGYKLMFAANTFLAITVRTQKVPFDPNYLIPLANFVETKNGILVKGDSPWKSLNDLLEFGRKNPGKLRWGHPGRGNVQNLYGLLIFRKAGVETVDIPYKGSPEIVSAILGGHLEAGVLAYGALKDHMKAGTLRYLVTVGERRYDDPPNVPCAKELGFPEVAKLPGFAGLFTHKGISQEIKKVLLEAFRKTFEDPEFKKALVKMGEEPRFGDPEFMRDAINNVEKAATPILKEMGLLVER